VTSDPLPRVSFEDLIGRYHTLLHYRRLDAGGTARLVLANPDLVYPGESGFGFTAGTPDIRGAAAFGIDSVLALTGITGKEVRLADHPAPTFVLEPPGAT
jgi:ribonucleotide monophosphatase NagD (HAD superfamily)